MTFSEYLVSKNIDEVSFASQDAHTYSTWKSMFEHVHAQAIKPGFWKFLLKTEK